MCTINNITQIVGATIFLYLLHTTNGFSSLSSILTHTSRATCSSSRNININHIGGLDSPLSTSSLLLILDNNSRNRIFLSMSTTSDENKDETSKPITDKEKRRKRDKVMSFLRKIGRVGGNKDFTNVMGVDEGASGKFGNPSLKMIQKSPSAYKWCTETGTIDDLTEPFPKTSCGTEWTGITDTVMGGVSIGKLTREELDGRTANVMRGKVSLYNNGGFIQMAVNLSTDPSVSLTVDASNYDGIELDVYYKGDASFEKFNVHLRNPACLRQNSSYRSTFIVSPDTWQTIRLPFSSFVGHGPGSVETPFDTSQLRRMGILAIGKAMDVFLGVSGVRFYKV